MQSVFCVNNLARALIFVNLNYKNNTYNGASLMKHLKEFLQKYPYRIYRLIRRFIRSINGLFQSLVIHFSPRALDGCRILLVYDITNRNSFNNLDKWIREIKEYLADDVNMVIIGNKKDLIDGKNVN